MTFRRVFTKVITKKKGWVNLLFSPKYLLYTNVLLSAGISTLGDLLEQSYERSYGEIDKIEIARTAHMAFSGSVAGIICHNWYKYLDTIIIGRSFKMVMKKLLLDQLVCSPIIILSFFATVAIFEENPYKNFTDEVKDKFLILYKAEWIVWPPAQIINFYFLPTRYRVVYDNSISLGYDIYTSQVKHMKIKNDSTIETEDMKDNESVRDKAESKTDED